MNAERLIKQYERIADTSDAMPPLRRFVLDLAVRGRLVPQDPSDEPASELLRRIAAEKARLFKSGIIGRQRPLPPLVHEEIPFRLPSGWAWARLGDVSQFVTSGSRDWAQHYSTSGAIFVRMGNLSKDHYRLRLDNIQRVQPPPDGEGTRTRLEAYDILISITGDVGMLGLIPEGFGEAYINQHTAMVRPMPAMKGHYLPELFRSPFAQDQFKEPQRGIKNSFRLTDVTQFVVPLPPLAEQRRIVAKIDELMTLCDGLEDKLEEREEMRDRFTVATLAHLHAPDPSRFRNDARFALDAWPALTARADQIRNLRQTILNLAVNGKLVAQTPTDEPAFDLLKRIEKEKQSITASDIVDLGGSYDVNLRLPTGWTWVRLEQISDIGTGLTPSKARLDYYKGGTVPWINSAATNGDPILSAEHFVTRKAVNECRLKIYPKGSLVVALYGQGKTRGQVAELGLDATVNQACAVVKWLPSFSELSRFVKLALKQQYHAMRQRAEGGPQPNLNVGKIKDLVLPLPPLAEQHLIVAKVDELMGLCDRLEASLADVDDIRSRLLDALLAEALEPEDERKLEAAE